MILSIESSCDETSLAILKDGKILHHFISSQIDIHKKYGGVIPEIASRQHVHTFYLLLEKLFKLIDPKEIKYVAYTKEPGLIGPLQIGELTAKSIATSLGVKLVPINHIHGHIYSAAISNKITYPALALVVSGGHTELQLLDKPYQFEKIGFTLDDAIGESFDKVATKLGLPYPGGPEIDKISKEGKATIDFPTPLKKDESLNFSFSGLKSSVINYIHNQKQKNEKINVANVAASFQKTAIDFALSRTKEAIDKYNPKTVIIAGGVSANSYLRKMSETIHNNVIIPELKYCTDNAAMIAKAAEVKLEN